jgi:hypothetical protein
MAAFDRIVMNVIYMALEIVLIAQSVLPVATLPNAPFPSVKTALRNFLIVRKHERILSL